MEAMCVRIIMYRGLKTIWLWAQKFIPQVNWNFIPGATMENPKILSNRSEAISIQLSGTACTSLHGPIQTLKPHGLRESESAHKESA